MNDKHVRPRGIIALVLGIVLSVGFVSTNAIAKPAPVTKITFKLDDHHVPPGAAVTSDILVRTRSNHEWVPFAGAPLSVRVDGTDVLTVVTGVDGHATVSYVAPEGGHVMRVVFLGDDTHKRARRSQGFSVVAGATAVPAAPLLTATAGLAVVNLSWTVPFDGGSAITGYAIYRGTTSGGETLLTTVAPGTTYADAFRHERDHLLLPRARDERRGRRRNVERGVRHTPVIEVVRGPKVRGRSHGSQRLPGSGTLVVPLPPVGGRGARMRIVIVDDHVLMRRGLAHIVEHGIPGVDVVEAGNASAALAAMRQETADVALIDVRLPDLDGLELLRAMKREWPTVPVIMLSTHENAPYVKRALSDGAAGYLLKDATPEDLHRAIDAAISGDGDLLSPRAIQTLFDDLVSSSRSPAGSAGSSPLAGYHLTHREHQILALLAEGRSNRSIATNLFVSEETVKAHVGSIFRKLGVANRTQAATMAVQLGVRDPTGG